MGFSPLPIASANGAIIQSALGLKRIGMKIGLLLLMVYYMMLNAVE
jgi:hypothetical protein